MTRWHSLYLSSNDAQSVIAQLKTYLTGAGYTLYNPFGRFPGMSYARALKLFVAPAQQNWVRVLLDCSRSQADDLAQQLSQQNLCLSASLEGRSAALHIFRDGVVRDDAANALRPYTRADQDLSVVLNASHYDLAPLESVQIGDIGLHDLPPDIRELAREVAGKHADQLFDKLSRRLLKTVGIFNAKALIDHQADWNSQGGQMIRAVMDCLTIPDNWRTPDFADLRSAYALACRREDDPDTPLLPGDVAVLLKIHDALRYTPVYGGRN